MRRGLYDTANIGVPVTEGELPTPENREVQAFFPLFSRGKNRVRTTPWVHLSRTTEKLISKNER